MPLKNNKVHVARNGAILGAYDRDKIGDLIDTGHLRPTDHLLDEATGQWVELSTLEGVSRPSSHRPASAEFKPIDLPPAEEGEAAERSSSSRSSRRSSSKGKSKAAAQKDAKAAIGGWIACLVAIAIAGCIWAYAQILGSKVSGLEDHIKSLEETVENLHRENQFLSEITPPGRIRAVITYMPSSNQVAVMSGATVGLYKLQDIQSALAKASLPPVNNSNDFEQAVNNIKATIPSPLQVTLTDSNGRVDLPLTTTGDYVLVASAAKATTGGTERYFWLIGFRSNNQPTNLLLLNEQNAISARRPEFKVTPVNTMASGL